MFNRFKLLLLLLVLAVLGILLGQNRDLLTLKFFCADAAKSCVYQTPSLPLALWMGLFIVAGIGTSLIWQLLNSLAYPSLKPSRNYEDPESYRSTGNKSRTNSTPDWNGEREPWDIETVQNDNSYDSVRSATPVDSNIYERQQQPQQVQRSGSTYSYKFKDASSDSVSGSSQDTPTKDSKPKQSEDEENWI
jgi:hypothetical protein